MPTNHLGCNIHGEFSFNLIDNYQLHITICIQSTIQTIHLHMYMTPDKGYLSVILSLKLKIVYMFLERYIVSVSFGFKEKQYTTCSYLLKRF